MLQLVNKYFDSIKMHGTTVKKKRKLKRKCLYLCSPLKGFLFYIIEVNYLKRNIIGVLYVSILYLHVSKYMMTTSYKGRNLSQFVNVIFYKYILEYCLLTIIGTTLMCSLFLLGLRRSYRSIVCELLISRDSQEISHVIS